MARFIGKNGVGIYEYDNGGDGWYRPHENCKMRFLGKQYEFCEVCKEGLRKAFCKSTAQSKYFIVRKGDKEATGDTLGEKLKLTYKDAAENNEKKTSATPAVNSATTTTNNSTTATTTSSVTTTAINSATTTTNGGKKNDKSTSIKKI